MEICDKKWIKVSHLSRGQYSVYKNMFKTSMLISVLCDYSDAYIVVKGKKFVEEDNDDKTRNKKLIFKNNAAFRSCISKAVTLYSQCRRSWDSYTNV